MIAGRPTQLWLGLTTTLSGAVAATLIFLGLDPVAVGTLAGVWQAVLGSAITLIANTPPTLSPGDSYTIQTSKGQPDYEATVARPPAANAPPVPVVDP